MWFLKNVLQYMHFTFHHWWTVILVTVSQLWCILLCFRSFSLFLHPWIAIRMKSPDGNQLWCPSQSLWSLIAEHVPGSELPKIRTALGNSLVDMYTEVHSEVRGFLWLQNFSFLLSKYCCMLGFFSLSCDSASEVCFIIHVFAYCFICAKNSESVSGRIPQENHHTVYKNFLLSLVSGWIKHLLS